MKETEIPAKLSDKSTQEVYDRIAPGWYNFRHYSIFRAELEDLAGRWQKGRLLNVGSGHGADFLPFKDRFELYGVLRDRWPQDPGATPGVALRTVKGYFSYTAAYVRNSVRRSSGGF